MSHDNVEFILVEPSHPGNVGAAARAIGTMGFKNLSLVKPTKHPHPESRARSSAGLDILLNAKVILNNLEKNSSNTIQFTREITSCK